MRASQVYAAVSGREYVLPDDVKALVPAVFTHRIICSFGQSAAGSASRVVSDVLAAVPVPTEETRA
jgi:MoxR-like ATPase